MPSTNKTAIFGLNKWIGTDKPVRSDFNADNDIIEAAFLSERELPQKTLINVLRIKLQLSLSATDIDAWSDLFADSSLLNAGACSDISVSGGALSCASISQTTGGDEEYLGASVSNAKVAQTITPDFNMSVSAVTVKLKKYGSPTDNVTMAIYATSGGEPTGSALYTSSTAISGATLTTSFTEQTFSFSGANLSGGTTYAIVLVRDGAYNTSHFYIVELSTTSLYDDGAAYVYSTSAWYVRTKDLYFVIAGGSTGTAVWDAVAPIEAVTYAAVCAEQTEGTGTITWYLSDDGVTWIEITSLDAIQNVAFSSAAVYLKCALTGNATVDAVAYGGY
jgi:hypothetical protein